MFELKGKQLNTIYPIVSEGYPNSKYSEPNAYLKNQKKGLKDK